MASQVLKLFGAKIKKSEGNLAVPGTVLRLIPQGLEIACGQGSITINEVQLAGHKRLPAADFLRGQSLIGQRLE
jgi:methionyl-tRNA formyltransferase